MRTRDTKAAALVIALIAVGTVAACGDGEGGGSGVAGGGASGNGGSAATAGGSAAGGRSASGGSGGEPGASGAAGSDAGPGGSGGSAGTGGSANTGGTGQTTGQRCAPGMTDEAPYPFTINNCYNWDDAHEGIPNFRRVSLRRIALPTPTVANENYALSLGMAYGSADATIELWGSEPDCGNVDQLLWWGPMRSGEICAEFRPTNAYSHLMMVWRAQWGDVGAQHDTITFCPTGTCGDARDGEGLGIDGDPLDAPMGAFLVNAGLREGQLDFSARVGHGLMRLKWADTIAIGSTVPVTAGYFRMHETEPFDDAWYCPGPGSTFSWIAEERVHFDFASVTLLANCTGATGSGTATFTSGAGTNATVIESSVLELASQNAQWVSNGCFEQGTMGPCSIEYAYDDGRANVRIHAFQAPAARLEGNDTVQDFVDTAVLIMPDGLGPPMLACAGSGTARFADDGTLTITLSEIATFDTCPGDAVAESRFVGDLEFL